MLGWNSIFIHGVTIQIHVGISLTNEPHMFSSRCYYNRRSHQYVPETPQYLLSCECDPHPRACHQLGRGLIQVMLYAMIQVCYMARALADGLRYI
jgi:hypothetical protein